MKPTTALALLLTLLCTACATVPSVPVIPQCPRLPPLEPIPPLQIQLAPGETYTDLMRNFLQGSLPTPKP